MGMNQHVSGALRWRVAGSVGRLPTATVIACAWMVAVPPGAFAQGNGSPATFAIPAPTRTATLRGSVRDSADGPLSYATVSWGEPSQSLRADDSGKFEIAGLRPGPVRFTIRRLGYAPVQFDLSLKGGVTKPVIVNMVAVPQNLSVVAVERTSEAASDPRADRFLWTGFLDRQAQHRGYFIGPEEVDRRRPNYISDLMFTVPGVVMVGRPHSRTARYLSSVGQCPLKLYLDGNEAPEGDDWVAGSDIKAVEVYANSMSVPSAFMASQLKGYCGSIVIWTK